MFFDDEQTYLLDPYQVESYEQVIASVDQEKFALFTLTMGSGKTLTIRVATHVMWCRPNYLGPVIIAVPQIHVMDSWSRPSLYQFPLENSPSGVTPVAQTIRSTDSHWSPNREDTTKALWTLLYGPRHRKAALITSHATLAKFCTLPNCTDPKHKHLPADCSKMLLVVDESQLLEDDNLVGQVVQTWRNRGGMVILSTAAMLRAKGELTVPPTVIPIVRTLAQHIAEGCAPGNIQILTRVLKGTRASRLDQMFEDNGNFLGFDSTSETFNQKDATHEPPSLIDHIRQQARVMFQDWVTAGRQKWGLYVPAGFSTVYARYLIDELIKLDPTLEGRILNGVGTGPEDQAKFINALVQENRRLAQGEASQLDIVVACRRFDFATDWPVATYGTLIGFPSHYGTFLQRIGRFSRLKAGNNSRKALPGYGPGEKYHPFADHIQMVIYLPEDAEAAWNDFWTKTGRKHRELIHMFAALAKDCSLAENYLTQVTNLAGPRHTRNKSRNQQDWTTFADFVRTQTGFTISTNQVRSNLIAVWEAIRFLGKKNPTTGSIDPISDAEIADFLTKYKGFTPDKAKEAIQLKNLRVGVTLPKILDDLQARFLAHSHNPGKLSHDQIRADLQAVFDQNTALLEAENPRLYAEARDIYEHFTQLVHHDMVKAATKLQDALDKPKLTRQEVEQLILDGAPNRPKADKTPVPGTFGNLTWKDIDHQAKHDWPGNDKTTLKDLVDELLGSDNKTETELKALHDRFEKSVRTRPGIFEALAEDAIAQMKAHPGVKFTVRSLDHARRLRGEKLLADAQRSSGSHLYGVVLGTLVPAIRPYLAKEGAGIVWRGNWSALGIDPNDKKWDDLQVRAGGPLPMPPVNKAKALDDILDFFDQGN